MSDAIIRDKTAYHARTSEQMERHLAVPPWSLRQKIALTCRILAAEGHESALAGQITARGDRPGTDRGTRFCHAVLPLRCAQRRQVSYPPMVQISTASPGNSAGASTQTCKRPETLRSIA